MNITLSKSKLIASSLVDNAMSKNERFLAFCTNSLLRHYSEDWGDLDEEDREANIEALKNGDRLVSVYNLPEFFNYNESRIYIITEWDRSFTTILFPSEY